MELGTWHDGFLARTRREVKSNAANTHWSAELKVVRTRTEVVMGQGVEQKTAVQTLTHHDIGRQRRPVLGVLLGGDRSR